MLGHASWVILLSSIPIKFHGFTSRRLLIHGIIAIATPVTILPTSVMTTVDEYPSCMGSAFSIVYHSRSWKVRTYHTFASGVVRECELIQTLNPKPPSTNAAGMSLLQALPALASGAQESSSSFLVQGLGFGVQGLGFAV